MGMRIDATTLSVDGLRYATPVEGGENEVVLGNSGGVTGFYENGASGHTVDAQAHLLDARRATWRVGEGTLTLEDTAKLQHVLLKLLVPAGDGETQLRVGADSAELLGLSYRTATMRLTATAHLAGALVERDATGKVTVVSVSASLQDVSLTAGELELKIDVVRLRKLSLIVQGAAIEASVEGLEVEGMTLESSGVTLEAERIDVSRGLAFRNGRIELADAAFEGMRAEYAFAPGESREEEPTADTKPSKPLPDLPALDQIDGSVAADVHLLAALPLVKNRGAKHGLRIPIDRGVINFGELEHGLSTLADALIDFEVDEDAVRLELDVIPLVKLDNITLLQWTFTEKQDRELAALKCMRLRKLLQFDRPSARADKPSKRHDSGAVRLVSIDVEHIDVHLSARAPVEIPIGEGMLRLDDGEGHAVRSFDVKGDVHVTLEGEPKRGEIKASLEGVAGTTTDLALGQTARLERASVVLPRVDSVLTTFDGARPVRVAATIPSLRISDLALTLKSDAEAMSDRRGKKSAQSGEHRAARRPAA